MGEGAPVPRIVLIRGLPGSGKSTMARELYPSYILCEADQYFETDHGYCFDPAHIKDAHNFCYTKALQALEEGKDVVVANTFTRVWEMQKYLDLPYPVEVVVATGSYQNVHGVPEEVVQRMRDRFEMYP